MNYLINDWRNARVLIVYRNFGAQSGKASHIGLGVNGLHTARVLRKQPIVCDVEAVWTPQHIADILNAQKGKYTHIVIEAPWVATSDLSNLLNHNPSIHFTVRTHSQIGFLQVEAGAVKLIREGLAMQESMVNFQVSSNSSRFVQFVEESYHSACAWLPNLYDYDRVARTQTQRTVYTGGTLKIGSFGAIRLMKNHATSAAAALLIADRLGANLEFHISVNREENGKGVVDMLRNVFAGHPTAKLVEVPWMPWPQFHNFIGSMDLNLQPSYSETFNIVSADSIAEGVPVVVGDAIDWMPKRFIASVDDADDIARVGVALLHDPSAPAAGQKALATYQATSVAAWKMYLSNGKLAA